LRPLCPLVLVRQRNGAPVGCLAEPFRISLLKNHGDYFDEDRVAVILLGPGI
jgi:hypothetical protein